MPAKKKAEPPDMQGKRFVEEAQRLIDAGELNPTEADAAFDRLVASVKLPKTAPK